MQTHECITFKTYTIQVCTIILVWCKHMLLSHIWLNVQTLYIRIAFTIAHLLWITIVFIITLQWPTAVSYMYHYNNSCSHKHRPCLPTGFAMQNILYCITVYNDCIYCSNEIAAYTHNTQHNVYYQYMPWHVLSNPSMHLHVTMCCVQ